MIAILMATYNGEKYLTEQLESIISQTNKQWNLYVRDDGSTDNTLDIIKLYCEKYSDKIFLIEDNCDCRSSSKNFMKILETIKDKIEYEYYMFSDQDDIWKDDKIEKTLEMFANENKETPILVHTDLNVVDKDLSLISSSFIKYRALNHKVTDLSHLLIQNNVTGCTIMFNKALLKYINFNSNEIAMHDWWLALIATTFGKIKFLNESTILYRQHGNNVVGATKVRSLKFIFNRLLHSNHIRYTLILAINQAETFLCQYNNKLTTEQKVLIKKFIRLKSSKKLKKIYIVLKNKFLKQGIIQVLGELLFI